MEAETLEDQIERLKQWHMDAAMERDAYKRENEALRSKLNRAYFTICEANAELHTQNTDEASDVLKRAIRVLT